MSIILATITFGLLLHSQVAQAEIYKWVDEKGTVHFTEDPATIPEKHWDNAESTTTEEDLMTPEERMKAKKQYEKELQERQQREKKEDEAREQERTLEKERRELIKRIQEAEGKCLIISYSQYEIVSDVSVSGGGVGHVIPGTDIVAGIQPVDVSASKETCVEIAIQNNSYQSKILRSENILAFTQKGNRVNPRQGLFIRIDPGQTYRGNICFRRLLSTIVKMELQGL